MVLRYTPQQLASLPPRKHSQDVLEGLLRTHRKRPSLLCGFPEAGKSTLAHQIAIAVATGNPFLGRETTQGRVIYWLNEDSASDVADDFFRAGLPKDNDNLSIL